MYTIRYYFGKAKGNEFLFFSFLLSSGNNIFILQIEIMIKKNST